MRQCPNCKGISKFSSPTCDCCGMRFFKYPGILRQDLLAACLRIGGAAILLATVASVYLKLR